jgi:hypothetical protein
MMRKQVKKLVAGDKIQIHGINVTVVNVEQNEWAGAVCVLLPLRVVASTANGSLVSQVFKLTSTVKVV